MNVKPVAFLVSLLSPAAGVLIAQDDFPLLEMAPFPVAAVFAANEEPAASFATVATRLRYTPQIDLQNRGLPEGQSDLVVRGSMFEQTGLMIGAVPLYDPQTGHYAAEVPFSPHMLRGPQIALGTENAIHGFNSNVATIRYGWAQIEQSGEVSVGFGQDHMRYQSFYAGQVFADGDVRWAADLSAAHAEGDGTIQDGDYQFKRIAGRIQRVAGRGQTDLFAGYLDKFYGWPGLYIGNAFGRLFPESDDYQTTVAGLNHRQGYDSDSHWEAGLAYRRVEDEYQVNRYNPNGNFLHATETWTASLTGNHGINEHWSMRHQWTALHDDLLRSTSLMSGDPGRDNDFTSRTYLHYSVAPEYRWTSPSGVRWAMVAGVAGDVSSEDHGHLGGLFRVSREQLTAQGLWTIFLDASQASQVAGYTALRSAPAGLFGGNANLGREFSSALELGTQWERDRWTMAASVFGRYDDDVTDWTWRSEVSSTARQANPVEVENFGFEWVGAYHVQRATFQAAYVYLAKSTDYQSADVDASYYVGNYARHRVTLSGVLHLRDDLDFRVDADWREQVANRLRTSADHAVHMSLSAVWRPIWVEGLELAVLADNLTDSDFEYFPGTPAVGRHVSGRATYRW